jgi:site-specific recombinase XerD
MSKLRDDFIMKLRARGSAQRTIDNYLSIMKDVTHHFKQSPLELTEEQICSYLSSLITERKNEPATVNLKIAALKTFYSLMLPDSTFMNSFKRLKVSFKIPSILSKKEIETLIDAAKSIKSKAIVMLLYSAGLRLAECAHLKPVHIESNAMRIRVEQGKGSADRYTILSQRTLEVLRNYWKTVRPDEWLFPGRNGKHLHIRSIEKIVTTAAANAHLNKRVHPHTLRHCFATHLLEAGVALPVIQKLLGHVSIKTTMRYLHVSHTILSRVKSPLDIEINCSEVDNAEIKL